MTQHTLGRLQKEDKRDLGFSLKARLASSTRAFRYWWSSGWWGDQGVNPFCVAFAWLHWLADGPVTHRTRGPIYRPRDIYSRAQTLDAFPGNNYDGTTVRAGAKALKEKGIITAYYWAWDVETLAQAILTSGPVVVGTNWYHEMFYPDKGRIKVRGKLAGGHAYLINGVNTKTGMFRIKNSWGRNWGNKGHAWISFEGMGRLIHESGEVCLASETTLEKYK